MDSLSGDDLAKQKAAAAAKAKAAALAKRKAKEQAEASSSSDGDDKAKAAAAAKAKAAAAAKAKAAAVAKAKSAGGTNTDSEVVEKPSKNQPLLDKYIKVIEEHLGKEVLEESYINRLSKDVPTLVIKKEACSIKWQSSLNIMSNWVLTIYQNYMEPTLKRTWSYMYIFIHIGTITRQLP